MADFPGNMLPVIPDPVGPVFPVNPVFPDPIILDFPVPGIPGQMGLAETLMARDIPGAAAGHRGIPPGILRLLRSILKGLLKGLCLRCVLPSLRPLLEALDLAAQAGRAVAAENFGPNWPSLASFLRRLHRILLEILICLRPQVKIFQIYFKRARPKAE